MSCGIGCTPNEHQPEFNRQWKAENNVGCCSNGSARNDCTKPSLARAGSPLAQWEAVYGKLITRISYVSDDQGHTTQVIEKVPCGLNPPARPSRHGCCSFSYRAAR